MPSRVKKTVTDTVNGLPQDRETVDRTTPQKSLPQLEQLPEQEFEQLSDNLFKPKPEYYFNRELSWIAFNQRVLHEGIDPRTQLLERVKFLSIFSSNLDEFFMVRVAGMKRKILVQNQNPEQEISRADDGLTPQEEFHAVYKALSPLVQQQQQFFEGTLKAELKQANIHLLNYSDLPNKQKAFLKQKFDEKLFPVLTPLAFNGGDLNDPGHPFPYISNLSLNLAVVLVDKDQPNHKKFARVKVPKLLPRFVPIPDAEGYTFVPLEQVIANNLESLFPSMTIIECYPFRITRDAELDISDEEADDLISTLKEELLKQRFGAVVRLEICATTPPEIRNILMERLEIGEEDIYDIHGLVGLVDLMSLSGLPLPQYQDQPWKSVSHPKFKHYDSSDERQNIFSLLREGDILVHHPYQSFTTTVQRFIEEASADPDVLAIKQTLYRTSGDSPIMSALIKAAQNGKQVAVLVELKARFDESNNMLWAKRLEDAGAHVVYGPVNLKTHTKTVLVVRREGEQIRRYVHIGTGNYNPKTARFYSDLGLLSCREDLGADLTDLFNNLTGYLRQKEYRKLLVAPLNMRKRFIELIKREIKHQENGYSSNIIAKMNSLVDPEIIALLYKASHAGVHIDLIVRGVCCLKPGIAGLSTNIRVMATLGRFLEHSRIFYFSNGGQEQIFIGSADWMPRNLDTRVEVVTPIEEPALIQELKQIIDITLADNRQAWDLQPDGTYIQRYPKEGEPELISQKHFMSQGRPEFAL